MKTFDTSFALFPLAVIAALLVLLCGCTAGTLKITSPAGVTTQVSVVRCLMSGGVYSYFNTNTGVGLVVVGSGVDSNAVEAAVKGAVLGAKGF